MADQSNVLPHLIQPRGLSGLSATFIGLGEGILLFPLLLYLPPYLGLAPVDAKIAAALVVSEVFFAGVIGGLAHRRKGRIHNRLTIIGAVSSAVGAFLGALTSKWVSEEFSRSLGVTTVIAGVIMFLPGLSSELDDAHLESIVVPSLPLAVISLSIGAVVGLMGSGNFLFIPLLIYVLKIPTRIAIGSSLVIYVFNSLAGFVGKLVPDKYLYCRHWPSLSARVWARWLGKNFIAKFRRGFSGMFTVRSLPS